MNNVYPMLGRLCLLAAIVLQAGCITVNLIEPSGPVKEVQLSGTGDGKILLLDLSGVISSQDKEGLVPHPNMLATFKEELTRASKDDKVKAVVVVFPFVPVIATTPFAFANARAISSSL